MRLTTFPVLVVALLAAVENPFAQAPVTVTLDKRAYSNGAEIIVTVTVPPAGASRFVAKPRFHFIHDRAPLPRSNASGWMEFPAMHVTQTVTLRAPGDIPPDDGQAWWLLLNDGDRLVARVPFEVLGWRLALQLKAEELKRAGAVSDPSPGPSPGSKPTLSQKGYLSLDRAQELLLGELVGVTVRLPPSDAGQEDLPVLRWGATTDLAWEDKSAAPEPADTAGAVVTNRDPAAQRITVRAPLSRPGRYELRLFRGKELLDVLPVTVIG